MRAFELLKRVVIQPVHLVLAAKDRGGSTWKSPTGRDLAVRQHRTNRARNSHGTVFSEVALFTPLQPPPVVLGGYVLLGRLWAVGGCADTGQREN